MTDPNLGLRLNIGCGRHPIDGFTNVDISPLPGVDVVANLDDREKVTLPFEDDSVSLIVGIHVIEHIRYPLPLMQELWRVAEPDALCELACPHGASDDAWEDPTHVRPMFLQSFGYFSQPFYWRADYGYRGDWQPETITLKVPWEIHARTPKSQLRHRLVYERNTVAEMVATLRAVKPARGNVRELQVPPAIEIVQMDPV